MQMEPQADDIADANVIAPPSSNRREISFLPLVSAKRIMDIVLSILALVLLMPLLILVALLIKIDSQGPILFWQKRGGLYGRPFKILKFRTMSVLEDGHTIKQARKGDPRVTRIGKWLRRTSIDELPQLINVLRGEMSLVGPRPHAIAHDDYYRKIIRNYQLRQNVKPGITGWAQVNGARGETPEPASMRVRVDLDVWYVHRNTLLLDIKILWLTVIQVIRAPNAF
ncbi:exopolysaccharide biosynthesis polyprenyl glycosylphosphotransferase [Microvirga arabica]|uniref:Exopolysaccharide biosynthesis polyprenyl glycosylphosphotransferase n=1 Tax=Microvirga arabica TaxID=1128671 RepID=A0ABV6YDQ8_9HYPH